MKTKEWSNNRLSSIAYFIVPLVIMLAYLYVFNPGIMSYDSYYQIEQIRSFHFNNWHPFFHTFIELICFKIYNSPLSVCIFQIICFSLIWYDICNYFVQKVKNSKFSIIMISLTIIIFLLIPINAIFAITLWKDILFSYALLYLTFLLYKMEKEGYSIKDITLTSLSLGFVYNLRFNGSIVVLLFLCIYCIYLIKKKINYKKIVYLVLSFVAINLLVFSLNVRYNVENNAKDMLSAKIAHYFIFCINNNIVESNDYKTINRLIDINVGKKEFNIFFIDPIYDKMDKDYYEDNEKIYILLSLKYAIKHPFKTIGYYFKSSELVWRINYNKKWVGHTYVTDINSVNNVEKFKPKNIDKKFYININNFVNYYTSGILFNIFYSPALYMYLSIIVIFLIKKYIIYIPNILNCLIVSLSIPLQDTRYLYPNIIIFYLLLIILTSNIFIKKNCSEEK